MLGKNEANYRKGTDLESCATCKNFLPPNACKLVDGVIAPNGLSDMYESADASSQTDLVSQLFGNISSGEQ